MQKVVQPNAYLKLGTPLKIRFYLTFNHLLLQSKIEMTTLNYDLKK